jgi:hypothetical protein
MRGRSLESGSTAVHGNNDGFGCQAGFVAYRQHSLRVLLRLLLGAESFGLERLVASCQELNLVVGHMTIVSPGEAWFRIWRGTWESPLETPEFRLSDGRDASRTSDLGHPGVAAMSEGQYSVLNAANGLLTSNAHMKKRRPHRAVRCRIIAPRGGCCR